MITEVKYPHLTGSGTDAHLERLPKIRVSDIAAGYVSHGWSADEICSQYPHLDPAEVHSALAFYFDHKVEIDAALSEELKADRAARRQPPSALRSKLLQSAGSGE